MAFGRRSPRNDPSARLAGFEAGVGLLPTTRPERRRVGLECSHCGTQARIDMIDMPRSRVYVTCPACGHEWDTHRMQVRARSER